MTLTERVALALGSLVSLISLMGGVWWFAVSLNDMKHGLFNLTAQFEQVESRIIEDREALKQRTELFRGLKQNQTLILSDMITLVYLDNDNVVMRSADGRVFRVPLTQKPAEVSEKHG